MRKAWFAGAVAAGVLWLSMWSPAFEAQTPAAGSPAAGRGQGARGDGAGQQGGRVGGGRRGRGAAAAGPSKPTPRWPDGRVNLSQAPGVKGFWNVMTGSLIAPGGLPDNLTLDQVPFQDWSRALYEYR